MLEALKEGKEGRRKGQKGMTDRSGKRGNNYPSLPTTFYPSPYSLPGPTRWSMVVYDAHLGHVGRQ